MWYKFVILFITCCYQIILPYYNLYTQIVINYYSNIVISKPVVSQLKVIHNIFNLILLEI